MYAAFPMMAFFLGVIPFSVFVIGYKYYKFGTKPVAFQDKYYFFRKGHYPLAQCNNQNPDNFFDKNKNCWTTDPLCQVDLKPKRPWEVLKDPTKGLVKLERDSRVSMR